MTPEQKQGIEKAARSIEAAVMLAEQGHFDFAASRAYYAMFYIAQAILRERGLSFSKHSAVHAAFGTHFAKTGLIDAKYHRWLLDSAEQRLAGDYELGLETTSEDVQIVVSHAREFLETAERLLGATPPPDA